jgi:hypothetical protein
MVCENYGFMQRNERVCEGTWHATCYRQHSKDNFPVLKPSDLDDALLDLEDFGDKIDTMRFREAWDGDHLMCPFQCDDCIFEVLRGWPDFEVTGDELLQVCIRQSILGSFWS